MFHPSLLGRAPTFPPTGTVDAAPTDGPERLIAGAEPRPAATHST